VDRDRFHAISNQDDTDPLNSGRWVNIAKGGGGLYEILTNPRKQGKGTALRRKGNGNKDGKRPPGKGGPHEVGAKSVRTTQLKIFKKG